MLENLDHKTQTERSNGELSFSPSSPHTTTFGLDTDLEDLLNAIDGGGQQGVHLEVVVHVVRVPDAHVEDVGREARHGARQRLGLQVYRQQTARIRFTADARGCKDPGLQYP